MAADGERCREFSGIELKDIFGIGREIGSHVGEGF